MGAKGNKGSENIHSKISLVMKSGKTQLG